MKEPWQTLKIIVTSIAIVVAFIAPIIIGCKLYDTPERRAAQAVERHKSYQDGFQSCRNFCVEQGAETFAWNGRVGPSSECLCGGGLP